MIAKALFHLVQGGLHKPLSDAMGPAARSAKAYADVVAELAHAKAGKPAPNNSKEAAPLVPIYIGIDHEQQEPLREVNCIISSGMSALCCMLQLTIHRTLMAADVLVETWR